MRKTAPRVSRMAPVERYAEMLQKDDSATLDDLRDALNMLEDSTRCARRVYGSAHPFTEKCECRVLESRAALLARGTPSSGGSEVLQTADDLAAYFG